MQKQRQTREQRPEEKEKKSTSNADYVSSLVMEEKSKELQAEESKDEAIEMKANGGLPFPSDVDTTHVDAMQAHNSNRPAPNNFTPKPSKPNNKQAAVSPFKLPRHSNGAATGKKNFPPFKPNKDLLATAEKKAVEPFQLPKAAEKDPLVDPALDRVEPYRLPSGDDMEKEQQIDSREADEEKKIPEETEAEKEQDDKENEDTKETEKVENEEGKGTADEENPDDGQANDAAADAPNGLPTDKAAAPKGAATPEGTDPSQSVQQDENAPAPENEAQNPLGSQGDAPQNKAAKETSMGNFGSDKSQEVYVVPEEKLPEVDPSLIIGSGPEGEILARDGEDGAMKQLFEQEQQNQPEGEQAVQAKFDDGPQPPAMQVLPASEGNEVLNQNRQLAQAELERFKSQGAAKVQALEAIKPSISSRISSAIKGATALVTSTKEQNLAQLKEKITAAKTAAKESAKTAKKDIRKANKDLIKDIKKNTRDTKKKIRKDCKDKTKELTTLETDTKKAIEEKLELTKTQLTETGDGYAADAVALGESRAASYAAEPLPSMSRWERIKNGGDFHEKKRSAKVEAAGEVGVAYGEEFDMATQDALGSMDEGMPELLEEISSSIQESKEELQTKKEAALKKLDSKEKAAIKKAKTTLKKKIKEVGTALKESLAELTQIGSQKKAAITEIATGKNAAIRSAGQGKISQLNSTLQAGVSGLQQNINKTVNEISQFDNPHPDKVKEYVNSSLAELDQLSSDLKGKTQSGISNASQKLKTQAQEGVTSLNRSLQEAGTAIEEEKSKCTEKINKVKEKASTEFDKQKTEYKTKADEVSKKAADDFKKVYDDRKNDFKQRKSSFDSAMDGGVTGFDNNLRPFSLEIDGVITEKANEAASKVQPRWKGWVKGLITVLIAIAVTVAICLSGGLVAAFLIGVAGGIATQLAHDAVDGELSSLQTYAMAGLMGGVGGLATGLGNIATKGLISAAGPRVAARFASNRMLAIGATKVTEIGIGTGVDSVTAGVTDSIQRLANGENVTFGTFGSAVADSVPQNLLVNTVAVGITTGIEVRAARNVDGPSGNSTTGLETRGNRPGPGERSTTRAEYQAQNRAERIAARDGNASTPTNRPGLETRGNRPGPGERSTTRAEYQAQNRADRIAARDGNASAPTNRPGLETRGNRPGPGERSTTRAEYEAQNRADRLAAKTPTERARLLGDAGESAARITGKKTRIPSLTGTAKYRTPDELTSTSLREVKNVANQGLTRQLRDFLAYSKANNLQFILEVRSTTKLSKPLLNLINSGDITLKRNPSF